MFDFFEKLRKPKFKKTGVVHTMGAQTLSGAYFFSWETRRIAGFSNPNFLKVGDELQSKMLSGKIARFLITEIKYMNDPKDQFFGTVEDIGYVE